MTHPRITISRNPIASRVVCKAADETVNNSDVLQNDNHFSLAVVANQVWHIRYTILYNSGGTPDIKFALSVPANATYLFGVTRSEATNQTNYIAASSGAIAVDGQAVDYLVLIEAIVTIGATAGNVVLQWAQNTADVSDTKVLQNSVMIARLVK